MAAYYPVKREAMSVHGKAMEKLSFNSDLPIAAGPCILYDRSLPNTITDWGRKALRALIGDASEEAEDFSD